MSWKQISFSLSIILSPKQKGSERNFQESVVCGRDESTEAKFGLLSYLFTNKKKTGDRQILHQVTHSSTPEYFLLLYKVQQLHCGVFSCLRGWDAVTI